MITQSPYLFYRSYNKGGSKDLVVIGLDLPSGEKTLDVSRLFKDGDILHDSYSNLDVEVESGKVSLDSEFDIVLLERR